MSDDEITLAHDAMSLLDSTSRALRGVLLDVATRTATRSGRQQVNRTDIEAAFVALLACPEEMRQGVVDMIEIMGDQHADDEQKAAAGDTLVGIMSPVPHSRTEGWRATQIIHEGTRKRLLVLKNAVALGDFIFHDGEFYRVSSVGHSAAGSYALVHVAGDKVPHEFHWILNPQA